MKQFKLVCQIILGILLSCGYLTAQEGAGQTKNKLVSLDTLMPQKMTEVGEYHFLRPKLGIRHDSTRLSWPPKEMRGHKILDSPALLDSLRRAGMKERLANPGRPTGFETESPNGPEDQIIPVINRQFSGNTLGQYYPPDNQMAISDEGMIVAAVNSDIVIANESGTVFISEHYEDYFSGLGLSGAFHFDPKILFDPQADRFIMVTLYGQSAALTKICIHYSVSSNPLDGWNSYIYNGGFAGGNSVWFDYPNIATSSEDFFLAGNLFYNSGSFNQAVIIQFDKDAGYNGQSNVPAVFYSNVQNGNGGLAISIYPLSWGFNGNYGPGFYLASTERLGANYFTLFGINAEVYNNPSLSRYKINTASYALPMDASQDGTNVLLDAGDCRIKGGFYADNQVHFVFSTKGSDGYDKIRYTRLDVITGNVQHHTFGSSAGYDYVYPAVAPFTNDILDHSVVIPFLRSSSSTYPEFRVYALDHDISTPSSVTVKAGETYIGPPANNPNEARWGDYIGICRRHNATHPTVWTLGQYGKNNTYGNWIAEISTVALPTCSGNTVLTDCSGTVTDGSGASNYSNDLDCSWTISPPGAGSVTLSFTEFDTRAFEFVEIYDGTDATGTLLGEYEGSDLPPTRTAMSGSMHIVFRTDGSGTAAGWSADYSCAAPPSCSGNTTLTACSGTIADGSGSDDYTNNLNCSWTISPPGANSVILTFTEFNTENCCDKVKIYDGDNSSAPFLGSFRGSNIPPTLTANSGKMYIVFETDSSIVKSGWAATYTCSTTAPPTANFTANPTSGVAPLTVDFSNNSTNASSYTWNFPGGVPSISTAQSPQDVVFNSPGTYTVTLTASGPGGSASQTAVITVTSPAATLSASPNDITVNAPAGSGTFAISSNCSWTISNIPAWLSVNPGSGTGNATVTYTYAANTATQSRNVLLQISGCNLSPIVEITQAGCTQPPQPTLNLSGAQSLCPGQSLTLSVTNPCSGCAVQWSNGSSGINTTVSTAGTYTATMSNGCGAGVASQAVSLTLATAPTAAFTANPNSGTAGFTANFTNASANASSYAWSFLGGTPSTSTAQNPSVQFLTPGTYTVTLTATGQCGTASQTATITVNPSIVPPLADFFTSSTCVQAGTSGPVAFTDFSQNGPTAWAWQFPGGTPSTSNLQSPSVTYSTPGVYAVLLTASNSAGSNTATKLGHITVVDVKAQTLSGGNSICLGESVLLSASGADNLLWQGNGLSINAGTVVSAKPTTTGPNTYTIVGSTGNCTDAPVTLTIQVNSVPTLNVSVSANEICTGQSATLSAQGADAYEWTGVGLNAMQGASVTATPNLPGSYAYTVKGTTNGCASLVQSITIQVKTAPPVSAVPSVPMVCLGGSVTLTASGASQYKWTGPGLIVSDVASVTATPTALGTAAYAVVGTGSNGCSATGTAQVQVNAVPVVQAFANPTSVCLGDTVLLAAAGADSYQWSGAPGLISAVGSPVKAVPTTVGTLSYSVVGTSNGCSAAPKNVAVQVANNPLSVSISASGCPGPNLTFTATVVNGGNLPNLTWYLNGVAVWSGPSYPQFGSVNGSQVYCTVGPVNQACTTPNFVQSEVYTVSCITSGTAEIPGLLSAQVMPNPNDGQFQVQLESVSAWSGQLRVFDAVGRLVAQQPAEVQPGSNTVPVALLGVAGGTYWLVLESEGRWWRAGFVVAGR